MAETEKKPVAPYMALGLSTVVYGIADAQTHQDQSGNHRRKHPCGCLHDEHQHARQADRVGRRWENIKSLWDGWGEEES